MAYAAMISGNSNEAHEHLRLARASNPNSPSVLSSEGFVLLSRDNPISHVKPY